MSTDVASGWTVYGDAFAEPGQAIEDRATDIGELASLLHRLKAEGRVLAYGGFGYESNIFTLERFSDETGQASYRTTARGDFFWRGGRIRARLHMYGIRTFMRASIDGTTVQMLAAAATTETLYSSPITSGTITPGADGEVDFTIEVYQNGSSGDRKWYGFVLEAVEETVYGDYDDYTGAFQQMDSDAFVDDGPLAGWHLSTIERNIRDLQRSKPRGACHCYPEANATNTTDAVLHDRCLIASVFPKCEGPYTIYAPPWATEVDVFVRCASAVTGLTSTVSILTDQDAAIEEDILGARAQTLLNTSPSLLKWTLPITPARDWRPLRVWIVHQSEVGTSSTDTYYVDSIEPLGAPVIHLTTPEAGLPHDGPFGNCFGMEEPLGDGTVKAGLYTDGIESFTDFAGVVATGEAITPRNARIVASPSVRRYALVPVFGETAASSQLLSKYSLAMLRVYGIYAGARSGEGAISTTEVRAAAQVDQLPSGTRMSSVVAQVNELALYSPPQLSLRGPGQRWLRGEEVSGGTGDKRYSASPWVFLNRLGNSTWQEVATWIIPSALDAGGDIDVQSIESRFHAIAFANESRPGDRLALECRLVCDGVTGDTFTATLPVHWINDQDVGRGQWDAGQAARHVGYDESFTDPKYEASYVQQFEWLTERLGPNPDWYEKSPAVTVDVPSSLPALCRLEMRAPTVTNKPSVVLLGASIHAQRRR